MILMKILYFELRKEFIRKAFVYIFIALTAVNLFWLEWDYRTNAGFTEDFVKIHASEKEISYYEELHQRLDGTLDAENVSYVSDEYQKYHTLVSGEFSTEYDETMHTGYVFGDYSLLYVQFYTPIKYLVEYKKTNDTLVEAASDNVLFFAEKKNAYEVEKNTYIVDHYANRNPLIFYETSGWKNLFSYDKSDLFILVLLIVGIIPSFFKEKKSGMETIQLTSVRGRKMYIPTKLMAHVTVAIFLELWFAVQNYLMFGMQYGLEGPKMKLYSLVDYQYTPFNVSVMTFYGMVVLFRCIGFAFIAIILTCIARLIKNIYAIFLIMIGYVGCFLYFSGFCNGSTVLERTVSLLSPFSLLKIGEIAKSLEDLKIFGNFFPFHSCLIGTQAIMIVLLFVGFYLVEKKGKMFR